MAPAASRFPCPRPANLQTFARPEPPQASRELAKLRNSSEYVAPFKIVRRRVIDDVYDGRMTIDVTLIIRIGDIEETEAASGVGVLHALDVTLRKALLKCFPYLEPVKVIETYQHATGASTETDSRVSKEICRRRLGVDYAGQVVEHDRGGVGLAIRRLRMANNPGERAAAPRECKSEVVLHGRGYIFVCKGWNDGRCAPEFRCHEGFLLSMRGADSINRRA